VKPEQLAQLPLLQVQLWPPLETRVPSKYPLQFPCAYAVTHVGALPPQTFAVPPPPHVCGVVHVPQLVTVRIEPQLSAAVTLPQFLPRRVQNAVFDSAAQPHTLVVPPPPHVCGVVHVPQLVTVRITPQLSAAVTLPQFLPAREQKAAFVSPAQPHTFVVPPPPHVCGIVHVPQLVTVRIAPQLSAAVTLPQFFPTRAQKAGFASGTQLGPQTLATPPPMHVCGAVQVPQLFTVRGMPQLSVPVKLPQLLPRREQKAVSDSRVQGVPHWFAVPAPPHVCGMVHVPQLFTVRGMPQLSVPLKLPHALLSRWQNTGSDSGMQLSIRPASGAPPAPDPAMPEPALPPVAAVVDAVDAPPVLPLGPDVPPIVVVLDAPPEPPVPVPDVTPTGSVPAEPVGPDPPPPVLVPSPGTSPSTPWAQEAIASAANTSANRRTSDATRIRRKAGMKCAPSRASSRRSHLGAETSGFPNTKSLGTGSARSGCRWEIHVPRTTRSRGARVYAQ
jgi:hypothetical protein